MSHETHGSPQQRKGRKSKVTKAVNVNEQCLSFDLIY